MIEAVSVVPSGDGKSKRQRVCRECGANEVRVPFVKKGNLCKPCAAAYAKAYKAWKAGRGPCPAKRRHESKNNPVTHRTCAKCGFAGVSSLFRPKSYECKKCSSAKSLVFYHANKPPLRPKRDPVEAKRDALRKHRVYMEVNRARVREQRKEWAARQSEEYWQKLREKERSPKAKAKRAKYMAKNRVKIQAWQQGRRARVRKAKRGNPMSATKEQLEALMKKANGICYYCRKKFKRLTFDHIEPVFLNGPHELSNLICVCKSCNSSKGATPPEVYARRIGLLLI